jgi:hypothetical protein
MPQIMKPEIVDLQPSAYLCERLPRSIPFGALWQFAAPCGRGTVGPAAWQSEILSLNLSQDVWHEQTKTTKRAGALVIMYSSAPLVAP